MNFKSNSIVLFQVASHLLKKISVKHEQSVEFAARLFELFDIINDNIVYNGRRNEQGKCSKYDKYLYLAVMYIFFRVESKT